MSEAVIDWEDAFSNADYIDSSDDFPRRWSRRAAAFRDTASGELDLPYGSHPREVMDFFRPEGSACGLVVLVHGGYWISFDKSSWSDLAQGALENGWAVAIPSYPLAPEYGLSDIAASIAKAVSYAGSLIDGPISLVGHSAGGHLVTRLMCQCGPLPDQSRNRVKRVASISGVHDLRPLLNHSMNQSLQLTATTSQSQSPALCTPVSGIKVCVTAGELERPEFFRQAALLSERWRPHNASMHVCIEPGRHHYDVIDVLKSATSRLTTWLTPRDGSSS